MKRLALASLIIASMSDPVAAQNPPRATPVSVGPEADAWQVSIEDVCTRISTDRDRVELACETVGSITISRGGGWGQLTNDRWERLARVVGEECTGISFSPERGELDCSSESLCVLAAEQHSNLFIRSEPGDRTPCEGVGAAVPSTTAEGFVTEDWDGLRIHVPDGYTTFEGPASHGTMHALMAHDALASSVTLDMGLHLSMHRGEEAVAVGAFDLWGRGSSTFASTVLSCPGAMPQSRILVFEHDRATTEQLLAEMAPEPVAPNCALTPPTPRRSGWLPWAAVAALMVMGAVALWAVGWARSRARRPLG